MNDETRAKVCVLSLETRYGIQTWPCASPQAAMAHLHRHVLDHWDTLRNLLYDEEKQQAWGAQAKAGVPYPLLPQGPEEAIEFYFECRKDDVDRCEYYDIQAEDVLDDETWVEVDNRPCARAGAQG